MKNLDQVKKILGEIPLYGIKHAKTERLKKIYSITLTNLRLLGLNNYLTESEIKERILTFKKIRKDITLILKERKNES